MNLTKILDDLKYLPNQAIMAYANGQNPEVPPFMALAELNRRKNMEQQYQNAASNPNQPSVKEQVEQSVATPNQPQGIAPQPPSAGMTTMRAGGIAKFAQGGATQDPQKQAQALAQLMQAINQNANATIPQQAQQAGIAPPQPGQAMPLQNYAAFQFATRPQVRPGTEAAPISSDLSLSQLGQYSPEQPIAAAHGGIMHHVPGHMYKFAPGGIIGFDGKEGSSVKGANISQDQIDAVLADLTGNPGINPGNSLANAAANAGNTYTPITLPQFSQQAPVAQQPAAQQAPVVSRGINIDPNAINASAQALTQNPGVNPSNALAQAAQRAGNTYTPLDTGVQLQNLDTGVQPKVRGNVPSPFQGIYDAVGNFFSNQGTTATNPRLGGTRSTPNPPAANQIPTDTTSEILANSQAPRQTQDTQGSQVIPNVLQLNPPNPQATAASNVQTPAVSQPPAVSPPTPAAAPAKQRTGIAAALPEKPTVTYSSAYDTLDQTAKDKMANKLNEQPSLKDAFDVNDAIAKHYGTDSPAGQVALQKLEEIQKLHNENKKKNEINDLISVMRGWGMGGPGGAADVYTGLQRQHQSEEEKLLWNQLNVMDEIDKRNREEKIKRGESVSKTYADDKKAADDRAAKAYEIARNAQLTKDTELIKEQGLNTRADLERKTQIEIAKLNRSAMLAGREVTANEIADQLKNDPKYKDMPYSERMRAAFNIKSGLSEKLTSQDVLARMKLESANMNNLTLSQEDRDQAKENYNMLSKKLDQISGMSGSAEIATPTLQEFITKAGPLNPKMTKEQLTAKYNELYGKK